MCAIAGFVHRHDLMSALAGNVSLSGTTTFVPLPLSDLRDPTKRRCSPFVLFDPIFDRDMNMRELPCVAVSQPPLARSLSSCPAPASDHRISKALFDNQRVKIRETMKRQDAQLGLPLPHSVCDRNHFDMIFPFNYRVERILYRDFFAMSFTGFMEESLNNDNTITIWGHTLITERNDPSFFTPSP